MNKSHHIDPDFDPLGGDASANPDGVRSRNTAATEVFFSKRWHRQTCLAPFVIVGFMAAVPLFTGCAAFRPLDGIPARYLPQELKSPSRSGKQTIDLSLLRRTPPENYLVDSGDVLGIYILGILGKQGEVPPVYFPQNQEVAPSMGYPVPVRDDGTITVPMCGAINVRGMTLRQVEETLRDALVHKRHLLNEENANVLVSLQKPRTYKIVVIRQEAGSELLSGGFGQINLGALKRGTGYVVDLPAYKNDVLNALARTGGAPGLDAQNTVFIVRNKHRRQSGSANRPTPAYAPGPSAGPNPSATPNYPGHPTPPAHSKPTGPAHQPAGPASPGSPMSAIQQMSGIMPSDPAWGHAFAGMHQPNWPTQQPYQPWGHSSPPGQRVQPHWNASGHSSSMPASSRFPGMSSEFRTPHDGFGLPSVVADSQWFGGTGLGNQTVQNPQVLKIPIRLAPGEQLTFTEQDIILEDGDIVFIESRDTEIFYTGGLLGGGQYTLPRDYDLDILGAMAIAQSINQNRSGGAGKAVGGMSALNQDVTISASEVVIVRRLPNGTQVPILVNLYDAKRYPEENVRIHPGDYIYLQYTFLESIGAFFERHILESAIFGLAASQIGRR